MPSFFQTIKHQLEDDIDREHRREMLRHKMAVLHGLTKFLFQIFRNLVEQKQKMGKLPESILLDEIIDNCIRDDIFVPLLSIFTDKQADILLSTWKGIMEMDALVALLPDSGGPVALTGDQLLRLQRISGVDGEVGVKVTMLVQALRRRRVKSERL